MSQPSGKCIFCEGGRLSKEHIFADWIQSIVPKAFSHTYHGISRNPDSHGNSLPVNPSYREHRQGDPLVRKLRVVCKSCNNGWMSRLQNDAKQALAPVLKGDWSMLTPENQCLAAAWIAMTCMVLEFSDPPTAGILQSDRSCFMEERRPPNGWEIWIGKFTGVQDRGYYHTGLKLGQITTIRVGKLVILAYSMLELHPISLPADFLIANGYARIWPPAEHMLATVRIVDEGLAENVHTALCDAIANTHPKDS